MIRGGGGRGPPLHLFETSPLLANLIVLVILVACVGVLVWSRRQDRE
jgi:hypothetical protein